MNLKTRQLQQGNILVSRTLKDLVRITEILKNGSVSARVLFRPDLLQEHKLTEDDLSPVILNEDWLNILDFKYHPENTHYESHEIVLSRAEIGWDLYMPNRVMRNVNAVHILQNAYSLHYNKEFKLQLTLAEPNENISL